MEKHTLNEKLKLKIGFGFLDIAMILLLISVVVSIIKNIKNHNFNNNFFIDVFTFFLLFTSLIIRLKENSKIKKLKMENQRLGNFIEDYKENIQNRIDAVKDGTAKTFTSEQVLNNIIRKKENNNN
jgi:hypothetical protein